MPSSEKRARPLAIAALCVLLFPASAGARVRERPGTPELERCLAVVGLDATHLRVAARGKASVTLLKTEDDRDVAVAGIIGVRTSHNATVARVLDELVVTTTLGGQSGTFSDPPAAADLRDVAFDRSEYRGLRKCRPGDCAFKLSTAEMEAFRRGVDWSAPNANAQADARLRAGLLRLVADYRRRGNAAMPTYNDGAGVRSSEAFDALLSQSRDVAVCAPELFGYLASYPAGRPNGAREVFYWSEERRSRMRPTLTVNHLVAYAPATGEAFLATKQIYANHYLEGGLEVLALVPASVTAGATDAGPNVYLISVRRFRFDYLPRFLNVRGRVRNQLVDATRADLTRARAAIEGVPADQRP